MLHFYVWFKAAGGHFYTSNSLSELLLVLVSLCESWMIILLNSIQFILYSTISQITNLPQRAFQFVHIRHPWPLTSHRIRKNSQKIEKTLSQGKKGKKPSGEQQRILSRMDRRIDVMCTDMRYVIMTSSPRPSPGETGWWTSRSI